ncbi:cytochrome P450 [Flagelloscypha sp. PMI_526]|nr:cytochrome P450 [Flagelloscypha sp. PMI_526]
MPQDDFSFSFTTVLTVATAVSSIAVLITDRIYQRYSHKWTKEPPMLPYTIPFIGHALWYGRDTFSLFRHARDYFPNGQPFSVLLFGKRVYIFTHNREVSTIFRKSKDIPFLPLIEKYSGLAWGISREGMRLLSDRDEDGDCLFLNAHRFYYEALKPGPNLDAVTLLFLKYLDDALNDFDGQANREEPQNFFEWSRLMLGLASTNAMMGPSFLKRHVKFNSAPRFLRNANIVDSGFFFFVNQVPRVFAKEAYAAREEVLDALEAYFGDEDAVRESAPMIKDREAQLNEKGLKRRDVAAYTFSAYVALIANAKNITYQMLRHIYLRPQQLALLRTELAPIFASGSHTHAPSSQTEAKIDTLDKVQLLLTQCPRLRAFYDETLRLYSSASTNRVVENEIEVGGYTLKKGNNVQCPSYTQHHSTEYFGTHPDPDVFDIERFLSEGVKGEKVANAKMVRAFGGGVSLCSGRFFAGNEVLSLVASVVWRYDVEFVKGGKVRISRRKDA